MATLLEHVHSAQQQVIVHGTGQVINRVLSIFLFTKRQRKMDLMTLFREENLLKGEKSPPGALYHHVHAKSCPLWRLPVSNTCSNPASQVHTMQCKTMHACLLTKLCDRELYVCQLDCSQILFLEHTQL